MLKKFQISIRCFQKAEGPTLGLFEGAVQAFAPQHSGRRRRFERQLKKPTQSGHI